MKKVLIIGSGGAGKSTFARRLHEATNLPLIHLDKLYWKPNWVETPKAEIYAIIDCLMEADEWIMDGNFNSTMEKRIAASDTVFFFDLPRLLCIYQIFKRIFKYYNQTRPDMGEGCPEKFDLEFLKWVWDFPKETKPLIEARLERAGQGKNIVRFRTRNEVEKFFENLRRDKVKSF